MVETILNKGFSDGSPWDEKWWRRAILLWVCPIGALVIALSGFLYFHREGEANYPVGYVVSSAKDCTLVVAARPDGPPVDTVQEHSGGRFARCGGLPKNKRIYYDPETGVQTFSHGTNIAGIFISLGFALLAAFPAALAWGDTARKRRARKQAELDPAHIPEA